MRLMVGFLVLNCPRVDMTAVKDRPDEEEDLVARAERQKMNC
jgi:hypothetical protein